MAELHNQLYRGNWSEALKRALGASKSQGGIERYGETLTPVLDLWSLPEWCYLRSEWLWARRTVLGATAAENSGVAIVNPTGSNLLVMVDTASAFNATANGSVVLGPTTEAVVAATYTQAGVTHRDTRNYRGVNPDLPRVQFWSGSNIGTILTTSELMDQINSPTTSYSSFTCGVPYVLKPGFALVAEGAAVNQSIGVNYAGRARAALPGEL